MSRPLAPLSLAALCAPALLLPLAPRAAAAPAAPATLAAPVAARVAARVAAPVVAIVPVAPHDGLDRAPAKPDAIVDLSTKEGAAVVSARWFVREARAVEVAFRAPGPDRRASGPENRTLDLDPKAGSEALRDGWQEIDPTTLDARRGGGRLSFLWYRVDLVLPERVGPFDTAGATAVLELVVDDYAEVRVDGRLPLALGETGGAVVAGWNAANRVVVARDIVPGRTVQVEILAANGPLSDPPANFIWIRSATLDLYAPGRHEGAQPVALTVETHDARLASLLGPAPVLEKLAGGFQFTEGPVVLPTGDLLFSDPNANVIYRWNADEGVSIFRSKSGYKGVDVAEYGQPGSNGLALDPQGRLVICEHGNRRVTRLEPNGVLTVLADRFEGKRLNSPNDVTVRSDGTLYFTDPPFGLPRFHDDARRELPHLGLYRLAGGVLHLEDGELLGPNGVILSPDERTLYVSNWDAERKVIKRYDVAADGALSHGRVFFDMGGAPEEEALDGLEMDALGNVWSSGPGGVWILSPQGEHLGTLRGPELPANFAWGGADGRTLYLTARTGLYRLRTQVPGAHLTTGPLGPAATAAGRGRP